MGGKEKQKKERGKEKDVKKSIKSGRR